MKNILALLADWANGIFAVLIASWWVGVEPQWWYFAVGILLSHSPDLDAIPELIRNGKVGATEEHPKDHRDGLHYPVVLLSIAGVATYLFPFWGLVFLIAVSLHLLNDLYGTGWGIKLFWPISKLHYKFLGRRVNRLKYVLASDWDALSESEKRLRVFVTWTPAEVPVYMKKWGLDNWIELYYFRINWISGIEYSLFCVAVFLMILSLL